MGLYPPAYAADQPTDTDRAWHAAQNADAHTTEPTPVEALREPWASWPLWTDGRWWPTQPEPPAATEAGGRPDPRRRCSRAVTDADMDHYGSPGRYTSDDRVIDRLGRRDVEHPA